MQNTDKCKKKNLKKIKLWVGKFFQESEFILLPFFHPPLLSRWSALILDISINLGKAK